MDHKTMINAKEWIHTAKKELSAVEAKEMCVCAWDLL